MSTAAGPRDGSPQRPAHKRTRSTALMSFVSSRKRGANNNKSAPLENHEADRELNQSLPGEVTNSKQSAASPQKILGDIKPSNTRTPSPRKKPILSPFKTRTSQDEHQPQQVPLTAPPKPFNQPKEKENTTPPRYEINEASTPIWAQFRSQASTEQHPDEQSQHNPAKTRPQYQYFPTGYVSAKPHDPFTRNPPGVRSPGDILKKANQRQVSVHTSNQNAVARPPTSNGAAQDVAQLKKAAKVQENAAKFESSENSSRPGPRFGGPELDSAFEAVLVSRNIPEDMRQNMRKLDTRIKEEFVRHDRPESTHSAHSEPDEGAKRSFWNQMKGKRERSRTRRDDPSKDDSSFDDGQQESPSKRRSRSRTRGFTFSKRDRSASKASKRARSNSRPRSIMSLKNFSSSSVNSLGVDGAKETKEQSGPHPVVAEEFVSYLRAQNDPTKVEVGRIHKLRILLRNETVGWVDSFILQGGMTALIDLLLRVIKVEWREEHEDLLLHETLLCFKGLCTTHRALEELDQVQGVIFPEFLKMLFDEERKGPSEFNTRQIIIDLLFKYLCSASASHLPDRARLLLSYLTDQHPPEDARPAGFIEVMRESRPYQIWCREITSVTKEVFWIFMHHLNVISLNPSADAELGAQPGGFDPSRINDLLIGMAVTTNSETDTDDPLDARAPYTVRHFPRPRPPEPAAPYVGGVEWEATHYLTAHLDLLNGLIASLSSTHERNKLRDELRRSGFEKIMGGSLRTCKEKFYGCVHDGLRTWCNAAREDGWDFERVRTGQNAAEGSGSPVKGGSGGSPRKGANVEPPPKLQLPVLGGSEDVGQKHEAGGDGGWL